MSERLTDDERSQLRGLGQGQVVAAVEKILSARLAPIEELADQWNEVPDYLASAYDKGRVDQRHDMLGQLLEVLIPNPYTTAASASEAWDE